MSQIIKRPFKSFNGYDWDKHYFETSPDQIKYPSGKTLDNIGQRETLWDGIVWLKNAVMELIKNLQFYNCIQLEVLIDEKLRIFAVDLDETRPFTFVIPRITTIGTWHLINLAVKKTSNTQISLVESSLANPNNPSDSWANGGEAKIIKVTGIRRA